MVGIMRCPVCGSNEIIYDDSSGVYVCSRCGTVIDEHPLYQLPSPDPEQRLNTGGYTNRIVNGGVGTEDLYKFYNSRERRLLRLLVSLNTKLERLGVDKNRCVSETSALLLRKVVERNHTVTSPSDRVLDILIYVACKVCGVVPPEEVSRAVRQVRAKRVMMVMNLARELGMRPRPMFIDYVMKYLAASRKCVDIPDSVMETAMEIIRRLGDRVSLLTPMQAAFGALLLAFRANGVPFNLDQFAACMNGAENPARRGARKIVAMMYRDLPEQIKRYWKSTVSNERS
jgi:transcription initiation factor TFIIIB Brf1 subunit/transcription initiation factor TFIIB